MACTLPKAIECAMVNGGNMMHAVVMKDRIIQNSRASTEIRLGEILHRDVLVLQGHDSREFRWELSCCGLPGIERGT